MTGLRFNHGREVVALLAPEGADDGDIVDHAADMGEPVGDGDAGFAVVLEGAEAGNHRALHLGDVVAKANGIDELAGVLVALRVERVDVADATAHEEEDHRVGLLATGQTGIELSIFGPKRADRAA